MKEELEKNICELQEVRSKKLELLEKELLCRNNLGKRLVDDHDQDLVRVELRGPEGRRECTAAGLL